METQELLHGAAEEDPNATQGLQFPLPAVSLPLCGLHQGAALITYGCRNRAQGGQHRRNDFPLTSHGHGPLLPPCGQHGKPQDPSQPGRSISPSNSSLNDPAPPSAPFLLRTFPPRALPGQLPGLNPGRKTQGGSRALEFLSSSKTTYTDLHCLQQ